MFSDPELIGLVEEVSSLAAGAEEKAGDGRVLHGRPDRRAHHRARGIVKACSSADMSPIPTPPSKDFAGRAAFKSSRRRARSARSAPRRWRAGALAQQPCRDIAVSVTGIAGPGGATPLEARRAGLYRRWPRTPSMQRPREFRFSGKPQRGPCGQLPRGAQAF
jgi:hypothetical protein